MQVFFSLIIKLIPLVVYLILGFIGGKYLKISKDILAKILIYLLVPFIAFNAGYASKITPEILTMQITVLFVGVFICLFALWSLKFVYKDETKNLLAFAVGEGNAGYFGIPVALLLFSTD